MRERAVALEQSWNRNASLEAHSVEELWGHGRRLADRLDSLQSDLQGARRASIESEGLARQLRLAVQSLEERAEASSTRSQALQARMGEMEGAMARLQGRVEAAATAAGEQASAAPGLRLVQVELEQVAARVAAAEERERARESGARQLLARVDALEEGSAAVDADREEQRRQIQKLVTRLEAAEVRDRERQAAIQQLVARLEAAEARAAHTSTAHAEPGPSVAPAELEALRRSLSELSSSVQVLASQFTGAEERLSEVSTRQGLMSAQLDEVLEDLAEKQGGGVSDESRSYEGGHERVRDLLQRLADIESRISNMRIQEATSGNPFSSEPSALSDLESYVRGTLATELKELQDLMANLFEKVNETQQDCEILSESAKRQATEALDKVTDMEEKLSAVLRAAGRGVESPADVSVPLCCDSPPCPTPMRKHRAFMQSVDIEESSST